MGLTQSRGALLILAIGFIFVSIILWRQHLFYKKSLKILKGQSFVVTIIPICYN
jgi:hypothetical protein